MTKMTSTTATWIMNECGESTNLPCDDSNHKVNEQSEQTNENIKEELIDTTNVDGKVALITDKQTDLIERLDYNMSPCKGVNVDDITDGISKNISSTSTIIAKDEESTGTTRIPSSTSDESHYGPYYRISSGSLEDDDDYDDVLHDPVAVNSKLKEMEEEQEQLNNSLIALTSHFAQVQLRLKQIVSSSSDEKERLLKELEEFAFTGIPDLNSVNQMVNQTQNQISQKDNLTSEYNYDDDDEQENEKSTVEKCKSDSNPRLKKNNETDLPLKLEKQREKQKELMSKLKEQLEELEKYAYETGDSKCIPSSMLIERQSVIIEQLKGTLALNLDQMDKLSPDELRQQVDQALKNVS